MAALAAVDVLIIQRKLILVTKALGPILRTACAALTADLAAPCKGPRTLAALRALSTAGYERARGLSPEDRALAVATLADAAPLLTAPFAAAPSLAEVPEEHWEGVLLLAQAASSLAMHHGGALPPPLLARLASVALAALRAVWRTHGLAPENDLTAKVLGGVLRALQILVNEGGAAVGAVLPSALLEHLRRLLVYGAATTQAAIAAAAALTPPPSLERTPSLGAGPAPTGKQGKEAKGQQGMSAAQVASARAMLASLQAKEKEGKDAQGGREKGAAGAAGAASAPAIPDPAGSSRVRIAALMLLQAVARECPDLLVPLLPALLPSHTDRQTTNPRPVAPTLATVLLFDPHPRARLAAAAALQGILEAPAVRAHVNLMAALRSQDLRRPPKMGFVPTSELLGRTVVQVQVALHHCLAREEHAGVLAAGCRAMGAWAPLMGTGARRTPGGHVVVVRRLPPFLLTQAVEAVYRCLVERAADIKFVQEGALEGKASVHKGKEQAAAAMLSCLVQLLDRSARFSAGVPVAATPSVPASPSDARQAPEGAAADTSARVWPLLFPALLSLGNALANAAVPYDVQCEALAALRAAALHPAAQRPLQSPAALEMIAALCRRNVAPFWSKESAASVGSRSIFQEDPRLAQASLRLLGACFSSVGALPAALFDAAPPSPLPAPPPSGTRKEKKGAALAAPATPAVPPAARLLQHLTRALKDTALPAVAAPNETVAAAAFASLATLPAVWARMAEDGAGRMLLERALSGAVQSATARPEPAVRAAAARLLGSLAPVLVPAAISGEIPLETAAAAVAPPAEDVGSTPEQAAAEDDAWATVAVPKKGKGGAKKGAVTLAEAAQVQAPAGTAAVSFTRVLEALGGASRDEHINTRLAAVGSLAGICDRVRVSAARNAAAAAPLTRALGERAGPLFLSNFAEHEKTRPSCIRGLGHLTCALLTCDVRPPPPWVPEGVRLLGASLAEGSAKARWNACYSVGLLLAGPQGGGDVNEGEGGWAVGIVQQMLDLMASSAYLKLRVGAALALASSVQRAHLPSAEAWAAALRRTLAALVATEAEARDASPAEWKRYRPALQSGLQQLLVRLMGLGHASGPGAAQDAESLRALVAGAEGGAGARWVSRALLYVEGKGTEASREARAAAVCMLAPIFAKEMEALRGIVEESDRDGGAPSGTVGLREAQEGVAPEDDLAMTLILMS